MCNSVEDLIRPQEAGVHHVTGRRINPRNFRDEIWVPAREAVFPEHSPLRKVRIHDLRHSAITAWLNSGVLPKIAQRWSGHKQLSVLLDTYVGVMREDAAESLQRIAGALERALEEEKHDGGTVDS